MDYKQIKNYEDRYAVTSDGKVWSYKYKKFLKPATTKEGYLYVVLVKNHTEKTSLVHRLVAEAFLSKPEGCIEVNHKDENKLNNSVENLEWCTHIYNSRYSLAGKPKSDEHKKKLAAAKVGNKNAAGPHKKRKKYVNISVT